MSSYTIVSLKLDFEPPKGGLAVSAVWKLACLLSHIPIGTKEHAKTHRRLPPFFATILRGVFPPAPPNWVSRSLKPTFLFYL